MWHSNHQESTSLEVSKLWVVNRHQTNQHLGCMGWSVCLFAYLSLVVQHLQVGCSVKHTLLIAKYACWAPLALVSRVTLFTCNSKSGFLGRKGSGSKGIWSSCNSPTNKKQKQNPNGGERCDAAPPPITKLRDNNSQRMVKIYSKRYESLSASFWKGMVESSQSQKWHKIQVTLRWATVKFNANKQHNDLTMNGWAMSEWWHLQISSGNIYNEMVMIFIMEQWWYLQWGITGEMMMVLIMRTLMVIMMKHWWYLQMKCEAMTYIQDEF